MKIILIGFMGSGKTTIANNLGKKLNLPVVDTDDLIEEKSKMKTPDIFDKYGETRYREFEIEVARDIRDIENHIIATGGGVILNKIIIDYLKSNGGIVVFLETTFEEIHKRIRAHNRPRPLFQHVDEARKLYDFRLPLYRSYADEIVITDGKSVETVTDLIIKNTA